MVEEKDMHTNHPYDYDWEIEPHMERAMQGCIPLTFLLLIIIGFIIYGFIKLVS